MSEQQNEEQKLLGLATLFAVIKIEQYEAIRKVALEKDKTIAKMIQEILDVYILTISQNEEKIIDERLKSATEGELVYKTAYVEQLKKEFDVLFNALLMVKGPCTGSKRKNEGKECNCDECVATRALFFVEIR
ncbi:MAG: hypothetical protein ACTSW7_01525 [Candidatus Thorarchaeota archaeon]|nr:hypothetical protein [Thermoplasmatales archaeon]